MLYLQLILDVYSVCFTETWTSGLWTLPPPDRLLPAKTLCAIVSPPPPIGEPLTPLSPPSSHLKGVVIPSPIVFYLTEMYKCQHILLSGRPFSEHQLRGGLHAEINSRNLTTSSGPFFNFGMLI